ncbi:MAG: RhuM family protein [Akkermansiaceae bacterium]
MTEGSVVKESLTTAADGKDYLTKLYNLDAILAVGYRVRSPRGVQFRRWASTVLKEFLLKGFVMDDERMKNPDGRPDHFDEMLSILFLRFASLMQQFSPSPEEVPA